MIVRMCRTCRHYTPNEEQRKEDMRDSLLIEMAASWCFHPISDGKVSTDDMILKGACGRDLKLWVRKEFRNE